MLVSLGVFFQSSLYPCNVQKIIFDRGSKDTSSNFACRRIHRKNIASKLHCSKTAAHNAIIKRMACFMTRKGLVVKGRLFNETDILRLPKISCKKIHAVLDLKGRAISSNTFEKSQQRIWTEVSQADPKATSDTSGEDKDMELCQTSSLLNSH